MAYFTEKKVRYFKLAFLLSRKYDVTFNILVEIFFCCLYDSLPTIYPLLLIISNSFQCSNVMPEKYSWKVNYNAKRPVRRPARDDQSNFTIDVMPQ